MQTIYLVTTGGTMEKVYSEQSGAVKNTESKVEQYLKQLGLPDCDVRIIPLMNKDSLEMTEKDRNQLANELTRLLPRESPIVITHGTDTVVETGLYLKAAFPDLEIPVILTGAIDAVGICGQRRVAESR